MHSHILHPSLPLLSQILAALTVRQLRELSSGYLEEEQKEGFPLYLSYTIQAGKPHPAQRALKTQSSYLKVRPQGK